MFVAWGYYSFPLNNSKANDATCHHVDLSLITSFHERSRRFVARPRGGRGANHCCAACLPHLTVHRISLSRASTNPTQQKHLAGEGGVGLLTRRSQWRQRENGTEFLRMGGGSPPAVEHRPAQMHLRCTGRGVGYNCSLPCMQGAKSPAPYVGCKLLNMMSCDYHQQQKGTQKRSKMARHRPLLQTTYFTRGSKPHCAEQS